MPCQVGPSPADYDMEFPFRVASAVLRPQDLRILDGLALIWNMGPNSFAMRIDGYASAEGGCVPNWNLSCERARAVVNRLAHPAYGTGVDAADLQSWAHGESNAAGPTLEANRRATLDIQIVDPDPAPADPETPAPIPSTPENCSPSRSQETATGCTPNPHGAHLPDVGGTHTESHAFEPCLLTQAEVAASPNWCVDSQQAHGGETCYREIPSVDGAPGDQYCYSENCCHNSRDAVSVVSSTSPGSNSCCETNHWAIPEHGLRDVLPEFIDDPERVMRDILGL